MQSSIRNALRIRSHGYKSDNPAVIHPSIVVGAGEMLTPEFAKDYHITHVINCASEEASPSWFKLNNPDKYACIDAIDSFTVNILDWYPQFKEVLKRFLQDPTSERVFVHCQCGINRSAFLALMYVCDVFKFPIEKAEYSCIFQRPCALANNVFRRQIYEELSKNRST
jgi:hypothetical protein